MKKTLSVLLSFRLRGRPVRFAAAVGNRYGDGQPPDRLEPRFGKIELAVRIGEVAESAV